MFQKLIFPSLLLGALFAVSPAAFSQDMPEPVQTAPLLETPTTLSDEEIVDKASFLIGFNFGKSLKADNIEINLEQLLDGVKQGAEDAELEMSQEELMSVMQAFQIKVANDRKARMEELSKKNQQEGEAFLNENRSREGVQEMENGLQYLVLQEGTGAKPQPTDVVLCHYKGMSIAEEVFDSSEGSEPLRVALTGGVIEGFAQALREMTVGAKWRVVIPAELAYGTHGSPPVIGPNQTLIFEIELVEILQQTEPLDLPK